MNLIKIIYLTTFLLFGFHEVLSQELEGNPAALPNQGICGHMVIMNGPHNLEHLRNCSVINGVLKILLFERKFDEKLYQNLSFPELREVTDFVLVYRVYGFKTLGTLFPNLALIRGRNLLVNYALTIYESKNFQEIGLKSLTKIMRGNVRFQNNPQLCFDQTIDWEKITGNKGGHFFAANGPPSCPGRDACRGCDDHTCWSSKHCQRQPSPKCHPECLDTCSPIGGKCHRCRHFINDNMCVKECPPDRYEFHQTYHCLTKRMCRRMYDGRGWVWGRQCVNSCPKGYKPVKNVTTGDTTCKPCSRLPCRKDCEGGEISALAHAQMYKECTHIDGPLQIRLIGIFGPEVMKELEDCLGDIEVIGGYLKVYRSVSLTSLNFLKNLTRINGETLEYNRYSLLVHENGNLQSLWDWKVKEKITLGNGTISFQFNPKLCLNEIDKLRNITNITSITTYDVSPHSNGIKFICDYVPLQAKSNVIDTANVTITWERFFPNKTERRITGYQLYYLEDPEDDVSSYFGRDSCFSRIWKSIIIPETPNRTTKWMSKNITDLQHSTKYAYYVETYDGSQENHIVDASSRSAQSALQFFTTKSEVPTPPDEVNAVSFTPDSITVYWSNDTDYRGNITRYVIELHIQHDDKNYLDNRNYCKNPLKLYPSAKNLNKSQTQEELAPPDNCKCEQIQKVWDKLFKKTTTRFGMLTFNTGDLDTMFPDWFGFTPLDDDAFNNFFYNNRTKQRRHATKFMVPKDFHQPLNRPAIDNVTKDDKYHFFSTEFLGHHQNFTITNLQHFTKYMVFLAACIGPLESDCGALAITVERTLKNEEADVITGLHADALNYSAATVRWAEPQVVNGAILSYTIEYKLEDIENFEVVHVCQTRLEHELNHNKYIMTNLLPGTYRVRVKATSLAGDGKYTDYFRFKIEEYTTQIHWFGFAVMGIATVVVLSIIFYYLQKRANCQTDREQLIPTEETMGARYHADPDGEDIEFFDVAGRHSD